MDGGIDFFVMHAFVEAAKRGVSTPMDVYDAAAWSAVTPLSETSIRKVVRPVDFPDFTRGTWKYHKQWLHWRIRTDAGDYNGEVRRHPIFAY